MILNRDLRGDDVPAFRVVELDLPDPETWEVARAWAWASLSRFALTFDPERFRRETGEALDPGAALRDAGRRAPSALRELHLTVLRAALWEIYSKHKGPVTDHKEAGQIDAILDAIYADVTGGQPRPVGDPGPLEPGLGPFGAIGPVNRRVSLQARKVSTREELYDRVAGLLLREIDESTIVSGLYLYPPRYSIEDDSPPTHVFILWLVPRRGGAADSAQLEAECERLSRLVIAAEGIPTDEPVSPW